jgi:hypothetical protein
MEKLQVECDRHVLGSGAALQRQAWTYGADAGAAGPPSAGLGLDAPLRLHPTPALTGGRTNPPPYTRSSHRESVSDLGNERSSLPNRNTASQTPIVGPIERSLAFAWLTRRPVGTALLETREIRTSLDHQDIQIDNQANA